MNKIHEYIANRVTTSDNFFEGTPCIEWALRIHQRGYGVAKVKGVSKWAHRVSYELNIGRIPTNYTVDHRCFNKICVNPDHLEAVTQEENTRRYHVKFNEQNPLFPCGHPRRAPYAKTFVSGKHKSGADKTTTRCEPCAKEYNQKYLKKYMRTYRSKVVVD